MSEGSSHGYLASGFWPEHPGKLEHVAECSHCSGHRKQVKGKKRIRGGKREREREGEGETCVLV